MTWCDNCSTTEENTVGKAPCQATDLENKRCNGNFNHGTYSICPSCGHQIKNPQKDGIHDFPGLPAGVKFDPSDQELLEHLEAKVRSDDHKHHPLLDEFIPTLEGENGICYTHPDKLPGVSKDGLVRHFFHRPSKAYTTGTRKRRKVQTDMEGNETRWHKTGKTRPVYVKGKLKGYKKILVLYTNYGKQRKPEKTNWVMHQYHLGSDEDEKDGEIVVSKVFYQTQPRQCGSTWKDSSAGKNVNKNISSNVAADGDDHEGSHHDPDGEDSASAFRSGYYNHSIISFDRRHELQNHHHHHPQSAPPSPSPTPPTRLIPNFSFHDGSSLIP